MTLMHIIVLVLLTVMSAAGAAIYVALLVFITFVCPLCLIRVQKCKAHISGPWDEAVLCIRVKQPRKVPVIDVDCTCAYVATLDSK